MYLTILYSLFLVLLSKTRARSVYRPLFDFVDDIGIGSYAADVSRCLSRINKNDMAQEVRADVWQSEGCRFDPTLGVSKCP